ncbi:MAG: putative Ig domain-containing protein [Acidimicrobiales bacterium]
MLSTRTIRVVAVAALLSTGVLTSGLVNVTSASAVAKPKLVVTPSTGLTNHKSVFVSGTLPHGVSFNTSTGVLSGTPSNGTTGTYHVTITATNSFGSTSQAFTLNVTAH